jgi:hypothetical protein
MTGGSNEAGARRVFRQGLYYEPSGTTVRLLSGKFTQRKGLKNFPKSSSRGQAVS